MKRSQVFISRRSGKKFLIAEENNNTAQSKYSMHSSVSLTLLSLWKRTFLLYLFTYLLTLWCRILLEKLTGLQLVKKFPAYHGTRRFITALTSVRQLSLFWANPIQSIYSNPTSWRSIIMLSALLRLGLPTGLLPSGFSTKTLYTPLSSPIRATCPAHSSNYFHLSLYAARCFP